MWRTGTINTALFANTDDKGRLYFIYKSEQGFGTPKGWRSSNYLNVRYLDRQVAQLLALKQRLALVIDAVKSGSQPDELTAEIMAKIEVMIIERHGTRLDSALIDAAELFKEEGDEVVMREEFGGAKLSETLK